MKNNIDEIKEILTYIIDNNKKLQSENKKPTSVEIIGEAGLGKTSIIHQIADEFNLDFVKLSLSNLEELGDLIGYPIKEYETCKNGDCKWVAKDILDEFIKVGYIPTGDHRMSYALPSWYPKNPSENGGILLLDDYSRATPTFLQATMELIDKQEFYSWRLPKNWTIVLTSNPDNGDYTVNSLDNAQKTRYISFELDFDIQSWARWAEKEDIDSRLINFCLAYPEIFNKSGGIQKVNPRSMVTFANTISGFTDFSKTETLALIMSIAKGCFTENENNIGNLFTTFIANKLDKLPTPESLVNKPWAMLKTELENCIYSGTQYRADIASILSTRFLNYVNLLFENKKSDTTTVINRILDFIDDKNEKILLSEDLIFNLIKNLSVKHKVRCAKLLSNPKVMKKLV